MNDLRAEQTAVLVFQDNSQGIDSLWKIRVNHPLEKVPAELLSAAIENHTLVKKPKTVEVPLFDQGNQIGQNVLTFQERSRAISNTNKVQGN
jgi:hypothetical protein